MKIEKRDLTKFSDVFASDIEIKDGKGTCVWQNVETHGKFPTQCDHVGLPALSPSPLSCKDAAGMGGRFVNEKL